MKKSRIIKSRTTIKGGINISIKELLTPYKGLPREIYILFIGKIVNCLGAFVHPLMSLILTQKIGMSAAETGSFVTILAVCQVPSIMLGGKLADKVGRKKVIIIFQILGAATLILCGLIPTSVLTAKLMIASSCFYSLSTPAYDALNADLTNQSNRKSSYSLLYMGVNIGFSVGPIIGGMLYKNYLSLIFIGDAITTLCALTLIILFIKEPSKINKDINGNSLEKSVECSTAKVLLKRPILILFPIIMFLYQFSYSQWGFGVPLQMGSIFGENGAKLYGFLGAFNGIIVIVFTPILTSLTKKYKMLNVMSVGGILYAMCFFIFGFASNISFFYFGVLSLTIGEILITINSSAFIANNTPASHRGRISSVIPLISGAGSAIGPMIMGGIIDTKGSFFAWIIVTMVSLIGSIGMFILNRLNKGDNLSSINKDSIEGKSL